MKKIKTIRKFKDDLKYYLILSIIIIPWSLLGIFVLYNVLATIIFYSLEEFFVSFFNSEIVWALVLLSVPIYLLFGFIKELIYPTKYVAKLIKVKNLVYDNKQLYNLKFKLNLESTGKTTELISEELECVVENKLKENKEYLISLTPNYAVKSIHSYDKKYKNISNKNVSVNMGIVFGLMYLLFVFYILSGIINLIYAALNDSLFYGKNIMYVLLIVVCTFITSRIYSVHKRYDSSVDINLQKEKKKKYLKEINLGKNNYPYGESIISLYVGSYLFHFLYKFFGTLLIVFLYIFLSEKDFYGALFFVLFACIIFAITYLIYFVLCVYKNLDKVKFKKLGIKTNKKIDFDKVNEFILIKSLNKFYVVDSNSNLVMNVRMDGSLKYTYFVGNGSNELIGVLKNKSFLGDELVIYSENNKPFICNRKTYPTFEYDLTGINYSVNCLEKARSYTINNKDDEIVANINCINYKNTKWTYIGCAGIKLNNNKKDTINLLLISLSIIISNLNLINEGNETLIRTDKNGLTVYEKD